MEQTSALIHWLMSVWKTANQMGFKKCGMMWRAFSVLKFEPNQDIIIEGERGNLNNLIISMLSLLLSVALDVGVVVSNVLC